VLRAKNGSALVHPISAHELRAPATVSPFTSARGVPSRVGACELNWRRPVLAAALVSSCLCRGTGRRNEFQVSAKELTERTELRPREAIATRKRDRAVSLWRKAETVMNLVLEATGQQAVKPIAAAYTELNLGIASLLAFRCSSGLPVSDRIAPPNRQTNSQPRAAGFN
jgi:hypothetical protein